MSSFLEIEKLLPPHNFRVCAQWKTKRKSYRICIKGHWHLDSSLQEVIRKFIIVKPALYSDTHLYMMHQRKPTHHTHPSILVHTHIHRHIPTHTLNLINPMKLDINRPNKKKERKKKKKEKGRNKRPLTLIRGLKNIWTLLFFQILIRVSFWRFWSIINFLFLKSLLVPLYK